MDSGLPDRGLGSPPDTGSQEDATPPPRCDRSKPFGQPTLLALPVKGHLARLTADERTLYYQTRVPGAGSEGEHDLVIATREDASRPFGPAKWLHTLNDNQDNYDPTPTPDQKTILFGTLLTSNNQRRLFKATRNSTQDDFSAPTMLALELKRPDGTVATLSMPYLRGESDLWFASNASQDGKADIYETRFLGGAAEPVTTRVPVISTDANEELFPVVSDDGLTIFFTRAPSGQPAKVWTATRNAITDDFSTPVVVPNINPETPSDYVGTWPTWISKDECVLYLSSDSAGPRADMQVYIAERGK